MANEPTRLADYRTPYRYLPYSLTTLVFITRHRVLLRRLRLQKRV